MSHTSLLKQQDEESKLVKRTNVTFASGNSGKIEEAKFILRDIADRIKFESIDLLEIQGDPESIARYKCDTATKLVKGAVIVEDTSLCFNALKGLPGPYIKSFYEKLGSNGLFKLLAGYEDKSATAVCTIAFSEGPGQEIQVFQGETKGTIVSPIGKAGFGWDPCFMPEGEDETYGEINSEKKNAISHRRKALELLKNFLVVREVSQFGKSFSDSS